MILKITIGAAFLTFIGGSLAIGFMTLQPVVFPTCEEVEKKLEAKKNSPKFSVSRHIPEFAIVPKRCK